VVNEDQQLILRRMGAVTGDFASVDPHLSELVGKDVCIEGTLNPSKSTVFVSGWRVLP
jgi:hypothetical protein